VIGGDKGRRMASDQRVSCQRSAGAAEFLAGRADGLDLEAARVGRLTS